MPTPRILAFSGSLRDESWNQRLAETAAEGAALAGADVQCIRLSNYDMPLFNEDIEQAQTPAEVMAFKELLRSHEGWIIASPEYNGTLTAALKNAIDWASRAEEGRPRLDCFQGKVVGLCAASPGALGGIRVLADTARILHSLGAHVLPGSVGIGHVMKTWSEGAFDEDTASRLKHLGHQVHRVTSNLDQS